MMNWQKITRGIKKNDSSDNECNSEMVRNLPMHGMACRKCHIISKRKQLRHL